MTPPLPATTGTITLTCWECGSTWQVPRRRGQHPRRCEVCQRDEPRARRLARLAQGGGLHAEAVRHERLGWVVMARTPWHEHLVPLRDEVDVDFFLRELANDTRSAAA